MWPTPTSQGVTFATLRDRLETILAQFSTQPDHIEIGELHEQIRRLRLELFLPKSGGHEPGLWCQACQSWTLDTNREPIDLHGLIRLSVKAPAQWETAQAYVASANAAAAAMRQDLAGLRASVGESVARLEQARYRLDSSPDWSASPWATAGTSGELAVIEDEPYWLDHRDPAAAALAVERVFDDLWQAASSGPEPVVLEPWAMALDSTLDFLGRPRPVLVGPRSVHTLLVPAGSSKSRETSGCVLNLRLELIGGGHGILYPSTPLGFVAIEGDFHDALLRVAAWIQGHIPGGFGPNDVRWSILTLSGDNNLPETLMGPSMGAAFALGTAVLLTSAGRPKGIR